MNTFYFLLDNDIIRDAITFQADGYTKVQLDITHLPAGINAGYYRWNGTTFTLDQALKDSIEEQNKPYGYDELVEKMNLMQQALDDVILGGAL